MDNLSLFLSFAVLLIYGPVCIISTIFTFSLENYIAIHDFLNINLFYIPALRPFEISINWFDAWAMKHNKIVGPILIILSFIDIKLIFGVINQQLV